MKRKIAVLVLLAMLLTIPAMAHTDRIQDSLFDQAKHIMAALDNGAYETAAALIPGTTGESMEQFALGSFTTLGYGMAQTRVSVAFYTGGLWYIAVPVAEPDDPNVETLVIRCDDGMTITGCNKTVWSTISAQLHQAGAIVWNEEYINDVAIIDG